MQCVNVVSNDTRLVFSTAVSHITVAFSRHWVFAFGQLMLVGYAVDEVARVVVVVVGIVQSPNDLRQPPLQ
jgi:hypothetical protein